MLARDLGSAVENASIDFFITFLRELPITNSVVIIQRTNECEASTENKKSQFKYISGLTTAP